MPILEIEGKIKALLPQQSGESARGAWVRQDFVIEYQDGNFPSDACFSAWGQDRVKELNDIPAGSDVKVQFSIRAREYQGRWYNDLRLIHVSPVAGQVAQQAAARPVAAAASTPTPASAPASAPEPMEVEQDDLPF